MVRVAASASKNGAMSGDCTALSSAEMAWSSVRVASSASMRALSEINSLEITVGWSSYPEASRWRSRASRSWASPATRCESASCWRPSAS